MRKESKIISNNKPIAFFDSGVGGLTVYTKLKELLPDENYLYFGDTKHMPYGEKTETELLEYAQQIIEFFIEKNAKAVVMACNTTSSVIYEKIKDKYNIKIYPIIQSVAEIIANLGYENVGVFATPATINSNAYKNEIQKHNKNINVIQVACPEWVKIVEDHKIRTSESIISVKTKLEEIMQFNPEKIILGCTHYPYLLDILSTFLTREFFIDPSNYFAEYIKNDLEKNNLTEIAQGSEEIFVSAFPGSFKESAKMFYELENLPKLKTFN